MKFLTNIMQLIIYLKFISTLKDTLKFRKIFDGKISSDETLIAIKVKETLNHSLYLRPNTSDAQVLLDTFYHKYHLSPIPLKKESIIIDLGANVGYTMAHFAYLHPKSKIFGVELDFNNFELAKKNLSSLEKSCKIIHAAAWSENGSVNYGGDQEWGFSILNADSQNNIKKVSAKTLDVIFQEFNIDHVDYLKMDIEGAEKSVLENPEKWISKVRSMKLEIHSPTTIDWCMGVLKKYDFKCTKDTIHPSAVIAINKKFL